MVDKRTIEQGWQNYFRTNIIVLKDCYSREFFEWVEGNPDLCQKLVILLVEGIDKEVKKILNINSMMREIYDAANNEESLEMVKISLKKNLTQKDVSKRIRVIIDSLYNEGKRSGILDPTGIVVLAAKKGFLLSKSQRHLLVDKKKLSKSEYAVAELTAANIVQNLMSNYFQRTIIEPLSQGNAKEFHESIKKQLIDKANKNKLDINKYRMIYFNKQKLDIFNIDKMNDGFSTFFWFCISLLFIVIAYIFYQYIRYNPQTTSTQNAFDNV